MRNRASFGVLVALTITYFVAVRLAFGLYPYFYENRRIACGLWLALAFLALIASLAQKPARQHARQPAPAKGRPETDDGGGFLSSPSFWSFITVLFAFITFFSTPKQTAFARQHAAEAARKTVRVPATSQPPEDPSTRPFATLGTVRLQGVSMKGQKSSALINGNTVFVGDHVGNARVTAIEEKSVTLEEGGKTITVHFNPAKPPPAPAAP